MSDHCTCVVEERGDADGRLVLDLRGGAGRCAAHADPHRLPATLTDQVRPGGRLELAVRTGDLTPELWEDLLVEAGFTVDEILPLDGEAPGRPLDGRLIRARRRESSPRPRVTSRPRGTRPPAAHATIGVGVIVRDGAGRILLGLHHGGTWELPGGKLEPGESVGAAAVRELLEETGLRAREQDVTVFAMLHDTVAGLTRVTMAAVLTVYEGVPVAAEPELVGEWRWTGTDELPSPLFVPSAQILTAWRPDLDIDRPPAHRLGIADAPGLGAASA
ncbi:nucleotide triphosphate diphosphatase NUDT15 [Streptomyces sp. AK02-01A]|uniref:nucleotide triphosphate diphosphatase NUDT15 n=1 Tax=Streptomyces sp. AK02-01A TaxID=3028648 RepID=UPI0029A921F6|nr:NUDIX domain-containing protein [Streptomyces sp. AK02-01A]MDX3849256.1 NUDIX domain-containing protein [Streptomyces sp. AK02-01A]